MSCCEYADAAMGAANTFTVAMPKVTFGPGSLDEAGARIKQRGLKRIVVFTDGFLAGSEHMARVRRSLSSSGIQFEEFDEVLIEPSDHSCETAARFYATANVEGALAVGGGSVIDTAKAAVIYATYPASFMDYFPAPIGGGVPIPYPLPAIIACPTTGGTGSEATAVSVIKIESLGTKFIIQSPAMMPVEAIIDPLVAASLPAQVVASSGFDLMNHALECYTARAYNRWDNVAEPASRPTVQGANPWSDIHAREALRIVGEYLVRGVNDAQDIHARGSLMWGSTLAGMAFGNSGTHLPHALSYGVSHLVKTWRADDYPGGEGPFVPHGIAVAMTAPSVFRYIAQSAPQRHLTAAQCLDADCRDAAHDDAGEVIAERMIGLMRATHIPNGLTAIGFNDSDAEALTASAIRQKRAIANAPRDIGTSDVQSMYAGAMRYW
jgi:alcohol dehydrogenase class IV